MKPSNKPPGHHSYEVNNVNTLEGHPPIEGYDFEQPFDFSDFMNRFNTTGFQAANLGSAIHIVKAMRREKATIMLSYTSNMVSSGVRETIKFLVKHRFVDVLVTTAGGIEEDIIKTIKAFVIGDFRAPGRHLFEQGINRTGNIFVPNDRYALFEKHMQPLFSRLAEKKRPVSSREFIQELGKHVDNEEAIYYWAAKNNIPVFCPGLMDGSIGDLVVFFKHSHPDFVLDISQDMVDLTSIAMNAKKVGAILLGGGIAKHYTLNANIFRDGLDYAVYINTAQEFDGSDSGARPDEAVSWAKIKPKAPAVKVHGDATILFPLLVAATFKQEYDQTRKKKKA